MRIVTYNLEQGGRPAQWIWLREEPFDLVFVQEAQDPRAADVNRWRWRARNRSWGTGIWSRTGALSEPLEVPGFAGEVVAVIIRGVDGLPSATPDLLAVNIHNPTYHPQAPHTVERILDTLPKAADGVATVIAGDFNVASLGERQAGEVLRTTAAEHKLLTRLREDFGVVPCWPTVHHGKPLAQTLRWKTSPAIPYHCDGIFVPATWADSVASCEIFETGLLSDHHAVVVSVG